MKNNKLAQELASMSVRAHQSLYMTQADFVSFFKPGRILLERKLPRQEYQDHTLLVVEANPDCAIIYDPARQTRYALWRTALLYEDVRERFVPLEAACKSPQDGV